MFSNSRKYTQNKSKRPPDLDVGLEILEKHLLLKALAHDCLIARHGHLLQLVPMPHLLVTLLACIIIGTLVTVVPQSPYLIVALVTAVVVDNVGDLAGQRAFAL